MAAVHRRCSICTHPRIGEINVTLREDDDLSWARLAEQYAVSRQALQRHATSHPLDAVEPPKPESPPRRKPRQKKTLAEEAGAKGEFLGAFKQSGDFQASADSAGVSRSQVQRWLEHDEAFSLRFNQARAEVIDHLEATAIQRATQGGRMVRKVFRNGVLYEEIHEWRPSDAALIKLLSSLKPEIYGDKLAITQTQIVKAVDADAWSSV